jgi:hypothetical protein
VWPTELSSSSADTTTSSPASSTHGSCKSSHRLTSTHTYVYIRTYTKILSDRPIHVDAVPWSTCLLFCSAECGMARCEFVISHSCFYHFLTPGCMCDA